MDVDKPNLGEIIVADDDPSVLDLLSKTLRQFIAFGQGEVKIADLSCQDPDRHQCIASSDAKHTLAEHGALRVEWDTAWRCPWFGWSVRFDNRTIMLFVRGAEVPLRGMIIPLRGMMGSPPPVSPHRSALLAGCRLLAAP